MNKDNSVCENSIELFSAHYLFDIIPLRTFFKFSLIFHLVANDARGLISSPFTECIESNLCECSPRFEFPYKCPGKNNETRLSSAAAVYLIS